MDSCLAEHAFCARDVTPLDPALPDLVVVVSHGAVDCAGYYVLAAFDGQWTALQELHRYTHHDPSYGPLEVTDVHDEQIGGHRVTRLAYTIEIVAANTEDSSPDRHQLVCSWPLVGVPRCTSER